MVLERIKTILLIILVAVSIVLSLLIWEGLLPPTTPTVSPPPGGTFWGPSADPLDLIMPVRIIVHRDQDQHFVLYPDGALFQRTWQPVLDVLQELGGRSGEFQLEPADLLKWQQAQAEPSLELIFDWPADGELWSQLLGYSQALTFNRPIKRMLLQLQPEPALLLASATGDAVMRLALNSDSERWPALWERLAADDLPEYEQLTGAEAPFGLYLPVQDLSYPVLRVEGERMEPSVVAGSFFADLSLTRCINERDGATIYTDGRRGLRVWPAGRVEYNAPELLPGVLLPQDQTLSRAVRFVTQHGGWSDNMRLARLEEAALGSAGVFYRLAFRRYEYGLPVSGFQVELDLSGRGVAAYRREIAVPVRHGSLIRLSAAELKGRLESLVAENQPVTDVYPGYVLEQDRDVSRRLRPVWLLERPDEPVQVLDLSPGGEGK